MEGLNWLELLPVVIPSLVATIFAIISFVLKLKKDSMAGMSKEVSEFLLAIYEGYKDGTLTTAELKKIMDEGQDVIEEAQKLLGKEKGSNADSARTP